MSLEVFTTPAAATASQTATTGAAAKTAHAKTGKDSFLDFILARGLQTSLTLNTLPTTTATAATDTAEQTNATAKDKSTPDLLKLLAVNPQVAKEIQNLEDSKMLGGDLQAQIAAVLALNQKAVEGNLGDTVSLTKGELTIAADGTKTVAPPDVNKTLLIQTKNEKQDLLGRLNALLAKLKNLTEDQGGTLSTLANLTPAQITELKSKVESLLAQNAAPPAPDQIAQSTVTAIPEAQAETGPVQVSATGTPNPQVPEEKTEKEGTKNKKDKLDDIAAILAAIIKLVPPQQESNTPIILPQIGLAGKAAAAPSPGIDENGSKTPLDLASKMNALTPGSPVKSANDLPAPLQASVKGFADDAKDSAKIDQDAADLRQNTNAPGGSKDSFDQFVRQIGPRPDFKNGNDFLFAPPPSSSPATIAGTHADASSLLGIAANADGSLPVSTDEITQRLLQNLGIQASGISLSAPGTAANVMLSASSAASAHPAAQIVAATIQKAAGDGVSRDITLQLDPPELGKVEIRLTFGRDKTVKAVVTTEHSDTMTLLQRDGFMLERALQGTGINADKSSLQFELGGGNYFNNREQQGDGKNGSGGKSADDDEATIQSTMNWYVDSSTGHMRYNILA